MLEFDSIKSGTRLLDREGDQKQLLQWMYVQSARSMKLLIISTENRWAWFKIQDSSISLLIASKKNRSMWTWAHLALLNGKTTILSDLDVRLKNYKSLYEK